VVSSFVVPSAAAAIVPAAAVIPVAAAAVVSVAAAVLFVAAVRAPVPPPLASVQGLTHVHFWAQRKHILWDTLGA